MKMLNMLYLVILGCVFSAFTWPWQEQPKEKNPEVVNQPAPVRPVESASRLTVEKESPSSLETLMPGKRQDTASIGRNPENGSVSSASERPSSRRSLDDIMATLRKVDTAQKIDRITGTSENQKEEGSESQAGSGAGTNRVNISKITASGQLAKIPRIQAQINQITRLHEQLNSRNQSRLAELQEIIQLTQSHEKILNQIDQMSAKESKLTVVKEEEILRQEMLRQQKSGGTQDTQSVSPG